MDLCCNERWSKLIGENFLSRYDAAHIEEIEELFYPGRIQILQLFSAFQGYGLI